MNLKEKVKNLPLSPGVYLMKDSRGSIIYVGKSKSLKKRVQSYFQSSKRHPKKIETLVKNVKDFDFILTDTEFEALMLECKLIKEIKPLFNKKMKSPQSYIYLAIQMDEEYPSIVITPNHKENDGNLYFGPYISKQTVERAIQSLKECCKILCSNPSKTNSPCLNYSIGLCIGICIEGSAVEPYHNILKKIIALLNGTDMSILEEVQRRMESASAKFDFETAAKYRDHLNAINFLIDKEKVVEFTEENKNIVIIEHLHNDTIKLFLIKRNTVLFSEKYKLDSANLEQLCLIIKTNILTYFNAPAHSSIEVTKDEIDEAQIINNYLKSSNCSYLIIPDNSLDLMNTLDEEINHLLFFQKQDDEQNRQKSLPNK